MDGIGRVTVMLLRAPFTRRARRDLGFCAAGAITGLVGFVVVAVVLIPALVISVSIVGTVIGLALVVAALCIARGLGGLHRRVRRIATGERVSSPAPFRPGAGLLAGWTGGCATGTAGGPSGTPGSSCRSRSPRGTRSPP